MKFRPSDPLDPLDLSDPRWKVLSAVETKVPGYYEKMKDEVNGIFADFSRC